MGEKEGWNKCVDINLFGVLNGITTVMSRLVYSIILFSKSAKNAVIFKPIFDLSKKSAY